MDSLRPDGKSLIDLERRRQIEEEGWTAEHDDRHEVDQLSAATACYALAEGPDEERHRIWPFSAEWWKPSDRVRNLTKAGALYLAAADLAGRRGMVKREDYLRKLSDLCAERIDELLAAE
jgi:hypothetical protein